MKSGLIIKKSTVCSTNVMKNNQFHIFCIPLGLQADTNVCYTGSITLVSHLFSQVNTSPSLTSTTENDHILKYTMTDNILSVMLPHDGIPE
jgi:hypothetical protein